MTGAFAVKSADVMPMRGSRQLFGLFLVGLVVPIQMTLVPLTIMLRNLGLIDSLFGLFWLYLGFGLPFAILVLRGFMKTMPRELIEAARVDGYGPVGAFFHITLPLLRPVIVIVLVLRTIEAFKVFDIIYVMTGGGPGHLSETINLYNYLAALSYDKIGYGSAIALVLFAIVIACTLVLIRLRRPAS